MKKKIGILAITSLVLAVLSNICSWLIVVGIIFGIIAIVLGVIAIIKGNKLSVPVTAIILSTIGITLSIVVFLLYGRVFKVVKNNVKDTLNNIASSNATVDCVSGHSWKTDEGSLLVLNDDKTFKYYKDGEDLTNNYFEGTYNVYCGEAAVKYIS